MARLLSSRITFVSCSLSLLASLACSSSTEPGAGTGGNGSGNTATGGSANPGGGNNPGGGFPSGGTGNIGTGGSTTTGGFGTSGTATGGAATAGTGSGGGPAGKLCATKTAVSTPLLTDFESYDGTVPAHGTGSWIFQIGMTAYAGLYPLTEEATAADYSLTLAAGDASNFAATAKDAATMDWGGGIGFWMGCLDATALSGLSFSIRGSTPRMVVFVNIATEDTTPPDAMNPAAGGTCDPAPVDGCKGYSAEVPITPDWTPTTIPWSMFTGGIGAAGAIPLSGDKITGISFGAAITYEENPPASMMYTPVPGSFEIAVDNLGFAP